MLHAAFVGVVEAEEGETHIYARPDGGPVADAWIKLAEEVVEPWDSVPATLRAMLPYPAQLFLVQSRILEHADVGLLAGRADSLRDHAAGLQFLLDAARHRRTGAHRGVRTRRDGPAADAPRRQQRRRAASG